MFVVLINLFGNFLDMDICTPLPPLLNLMQNFFFLLGSQYPVSLGPMVLLLNHVFCFYWAPSTPFLRAR